MFDQDAEILFKSWFTEHGGTVVKVARAYTFTAEDCQDLAQEILLQVWRSMPRFQGRASASTWSYRIALNTAMSWRRKDRRRRTRQLPLLEAEDLCAAESELHLVHRETINRLYEAIRQLPATDAALVLLFLDDLSYREMAQVLGISESNVGVKLNRAKKALAEQMKEKPNES